MRILGWRELEELSYGGRAEGAMFSKFRLLDLEMPAVL
jgi:hypothetical protein